MPTALAPSVVTARDSKGLKFMSIVEAAYNKARLPGDEAQRVNDTSGLSELIGNFIAKNRRLNQFAGEEVHSNYTYPPEYTRRPIGEQIEMIAKLFGLDPQNAYAFARNLLELPEGAEGWYAVPSIDMVATKYFPTVEDPAERYCKAVNLVLEMIGKARRFTNYRKGQLTPGRLRQHVRTVDALAEIAKSQPGDIWIIAAQFGKCHAGRSVRRAREVFASGEFGLGVFLVGCMILTHPERLVRWEQLHMDCPGDEFASVADGDFSNAPIFNFNDNEVKFNANWFNNANENYGSVSGFLPKLLLIQTASARLTAGVSVTALLWT